MKQAMIAEVQRFCIHDGPGIRTTVFFKGCPLSCAWCHNPETIKAAPEMLYFEQKCIGCGSCLAVCKKGAHRFEGGRHTVDVSACLSCDRMEECALSCPAQAMAVCGRRIGSGGLLEQVLLDWEFYGEEGGVTCSGGEPLMQADFLGEFLSLCRDRGLNVCMDTSLQVKWSKILPLLPMIDLFLVDIKCMDPKRAVRYTGADGRLAAENLIRLSEAKKPVILRMPLAAGVNDAPEEMEARRRLMEKLNNVVRVDCFAVANHAASKYRAMGKEAPEWNRGADLREMEERMRRETGGKRWERPIFTERPGQDAGM